MTNQVEVLAMFEFNLHHVIEDRNGGSSDSCIPHTLHTVIYTLSLYVYYTLYIRTSVIYYYTCAKVAYFSFEKGEVGCLRCCCVVLFVICIV